MRNIHLAALLLCSTVSMCSFGQTTTLISKFTWNVLGQDPKISDVGPNAISISSSALIDSSGAGGTNGLNAGPSDNKEDIDMFFAYDSSFDVEGIDLSIDYQRDESTGTFFKRGSAFSFLSASHLNVSFKLKNPGDSSLDTTISSGNAYAIPLDDVFRNYRFKYYPNTGIAQLFVDGVQEWSATFTAGMVLDWTGADDIKIGDKMDGSGLNKTIYDNYILKGITYSPLPLELISFSGIENREKSTVELIWSTASETNNDYFSVERSQDGFSWKVLENIKGAGNNTSILTYSTTDFNPFSGISYYRLKQTDFDGRHDYSPIISVNFKQLSIFEVFPNPINQGDIIHFENLNSTTQDVFISIYDSKGILLKSYPISQFDSILKIKNDLKPGLYFVTFENQTKKIVVQG